ncbi:MAG TPA: protein kinase [Candidatus Sulfotelmatobacter sp.]
MENPASPKKLAGRYEVREILGQGGMGLVYRAYDTVVRREVAVKTILDIPDPASLQLFYKECDVLASMSHPNIVEIFDIGEFEDEGKKKPYFVMPLLPGTTLDHFIRKASHRLTVERTIEIIFQTCRGLQAAHERGLVHRDLKPSNIFVMEDDSVKIIDFGVAHMADSHTTRAQKGTLLYMSPEQIQLKPLSASSDIFSLSVVCYEALTGRHPFQRSRADEVVEAILRQSPPPASDLNSTVNLPVGRVVHKGMAKQAWHRFASAKEFGESLNKALRNEPIEFFDPERTRPRMQRATKALEEGDFQFAGEILGELEAEGHVDVAIAALRRQLDNSVRRKTLTQLLEAARARFEEEEDPLALQKLQEALQIEPDNATALALKSKIENRRSERQIEGWYRLARQHIDNHAYPHAREALQNVLQLRPRESRALQLLADVDRQEQDYKKVRQEKEQIHRAAMDAWQKGDVSSALAKLGVVLELDRRAPDTLNRESGTSYQSFYNEVRSEHDAMNTAYAEARKYLTDHHFAKAKTLCQDYLQKYPTNAIFQSLRYDIEEQQRQELSALIASIDRQVEAEPDLEKRVNILREALESHPDELHFERALRLVQDKRDLVNSIVSRAHLHEEQGAFGDALNDWEILRTIYSQYPGLKFEVERIQKRRDQQVRIEAKSKLIEQVDSCLHASDFSHALDLLQAVAIDYPNDSELRELEKLAQQGVQRKTQAQLLMTEGQDLCGQQKSVEGIQLLRQAYELDENNSLARAVLANALVEYAHGLVESDWSEAEKLSREALDLNPSHPMGKTLRTLILDQKRESFVGDCVSQARKLQGAGDLPAALSRVEEGLSKYPREQRLIQIQETVQRELQTHRRQTRRRDLEELRRLEGEVASADSEDVKQTAAARARELADKYADDEELLTTANGLLQKLNLPGVTGRGASQDISSSSATLSFVSAPTIGEPALTQAAEALPPVPAVVVAQQDAPPAVSANPSSTVVKTPAKEVALQRLPRSRPPLSQH